jgi:hypothetical protein
MPSLVSILFSVSSNSSKRIFLFRPDFDDSLAVFYPSRNCGLFLNRLQENSKTSAQQIPSQFDFGCLFCRWHGELDLRISTGNDETLLNRRRSTFDDCIRCNYDSSSARRCHEVCADFPPKLLLKIRLVSSKFEFEFDKHLFKSRQVFCEASHVNKFRISAVLVSFR